jgi:hypothetical protein
MRRENGITLIAGGGRTGEQAVLLSAQEVSQIIATRINEQKDENPGVTNQKNQGNGSHGPLDVSSSERGEKACIM